MQVAVELVAARVIGDDLRFAVRVAICPRTGDPDATARAELATLFPALWLRRAIVRSTSWRYEEEHIVLTYLGYSDDCDVGSLPFTIPLARVAEIAAGPAAVAAHAIRQLAFLLREEPDRYAGQLRPETVRTLMRIAPAAGGRIPQRAA